LAEKFILSGRQRIQAYELMKLRLIVVGKNRSDNDVVKYDEDWSDERIAAEVGNPKAVKAVSTTRVDLFGYLLGSGTHGVLANVNNTGDKDIAALTELVSELRGDLNRAIRSINMLAKTEGLTAALIEERSNGH
jgi:hypothetical protein